MQVSVITPTIRPEGLDIVRKALKKQTFRDFEWIIGSKEDPEIPEATWIHDDFTGGFWSLNRIYNALFESAKGDIIVSWQDYIHAGPDALQKFVQNLETEGPNTIISAVGDHYAELNKYGKPMIKVWSDPRKTTEHGSFYQCNFPDIEWNLCATHKKTHTDIGGFCEKLDHTGYGMDGYQVNERLNDTGCKFFLDQSLESMTLRHNRDSYDGEDNWNKNNNLHNGGYEQVRKELKLSGNWPVIRSHSHKNKNTQ